MPKPPTAEGQRPRPGDLFLDHVAHELADPDATTRFFETLGFVVTPAQASAGGATTRRVMLEEGCIELVAASGVAAPLRRLAFGTPDAAAEHGRLAAHGFSPPPIARHEFDLEGQCVRYAVVRARPVGFPDSCLEFVEQQRPAGLWQPRFLRHQNGVEVLVAVIICADDPAETGARIAHFGGMLPWRAGPYVRLETARGQILVGARADCRALFGQAPAASAIAGYALACQDPAAFAGRCERAGLPVLGRGALRVTALPGMLGGSWMFGKLEALRDALASPSDTAWRS
ncbi:MAG: VOC family protein [Betaproteobacteria bacterium]|nr:VOC family protein [Betaproteobacteria bacterium]